MEEDEKEWLLVSAVEHINGKYNPNEHTITSHRPPGPVAPRSHPPMQM